MSSVAVRKTDFTSSVEDMIHENVVYGVKEKHPGFAFDRLFAAEELHLDYDITLLPPNKFLLPSQDVLVKFTLDRKKVIHTQAEPKPCIILGIHPYDLHAVKLLDAVFAGDRVDVHYRARRNATTIIGTDCLHPWPYSFAASMGTALPPKIFDLWLTDLGTEFLIEVSTSRGNDLCERYFNARSASNFLLEQRDKLRREALERYQLAVKVPPREIPEILDKGWDNPLWEELGEKCFSCGSCTMVCPTCVCFDVQDSIELNLKKGERRRIWDSCMFDAFDKVASGENFRPTGTERLRHRLYRKGKYMLERWGELGCVGCGRCIHACLVDIASPVYAYNRLAEEGR
ncbi:MAG: 4Fe-4S dicluster domain-containing protein [Thermodesulfobacteriota bacterium]